VDTDDLTPMAYEAIVMAEEVLDVLKAEIGASAPDKKSEDDFLRGVRTHLRRVLRSPREYLDDWNYLDSVDIRSFRRGVKGILAHVEGTLATPYEERRTTIQIDLLCCGELGDNVTSFFFCNLKFCHSLLRVNYYER
jgi:hypothetical protein